MKSLFYKTFDVRAQLSQFVDDNIEKITILSISQSSEGSTLWYFKNEETLASEELNNFLTDLYANRDNYSRAKIIELIKEKLFN